MFRKLLLTRLFRQPLAGILLTQLLPLAASSESIRAFLQVHCVECHDAISRKGGIQLDSLNLAAPSADSLELLGNVYKQLDLREMPPAKKPQPTTADREAFLDSLGRTLRAATTSTETNSSRATSRRLNRFEYQNTLRDLLGLDLNVLELLPEDGAAFGFDKVSSALTLSAVQLEKYLEAADVALDAVLQVGPQPKFIREEFTGADVVDRWDARSFRKEGTNVWAVLFNSTESPTELKKFRASAPGEYTVRILANGIQTSNKPMIFRVYGGTFHSGGRSRLLGYFEVPPDRPKAVEFTTRFEARRDTLKIVPYGSVPWHNDPLSYSGPGLAVHSVIVEGPLEANHWPPPANQKLLGNVDPKLGTLSDAKAILRLFAPRAFRRPITDAELSPYLKLVEERLQSASPFIDALRAGLKAILVSPRFLLLLESPGKLDAYALASRLSYFLWSTTPDEALIESAASGRLETPEELHAQVERMLAHPNARRFTTDFTGQWLGLRQIDFTTPDPKLYPEFDEWLQVSMPEETHAFFDELLQHNLSLLQFVQSDFVMLNERLARHYDLTGSTGLEIRKYPLPKNSHRGGVISHASVLKVSANGTTTSPVIRGAWMLDRILGKTVPPPPPNVPSAEPDIRGAVGIRDQLAKHRADPSCAGCHSKMDPIGFALESYDVIGGWRERYRISPQPGVRVNPIIATLLVHQRPHKIAFGKTVDTRDQLSNGRRFSNLEELQSILLENPDAIARGLTQKLLVYATGQGITPGDEPAIGEIVLAVKRHDYGLRSLIHEVVASQTFQHK